MIKANEESEVGVMPSEKLLADLGKFNEQLVNAGIRARAAELKKKQ